jgi:cytochrome c oxidase assembly factor CtaG
VSATAWSYDPQLWGWIVAVVLAALYVVMVRRPGFGATRHQVACFVGGEAVLLVALTWPLADLASHWSLVALVFQRLLLMLAVPPLLILSLPRPAVVALTRPAPVDAVVRTCSRGPVAVVVVTVVSVGTLTTGAVEAQASSMVARAAFDLLLLAAGFVLWTPVLDFLPGSHRPSVLGRAGYLIVQSIVPSFLSVVWIFAQHPLYPPFAHRRLVGMSPLLDQQLAGFVAKLATIAVLWSVAFVMLSRSQRSVSTGGDPDPLRWADVERELERAERRERRTPGAPPEPQG